MASDQDPRSPLEILPIEVWEKIFTYLNSRDLISCYKTAESWRQELEKRRTEFFMTEVFPLISGFLDRHDVLDGRLVCKSWKESVEASLQNHAAHFNTVPSYTLVENAVNHELSRCHDVIPRNLNFNFNFMLWRDANLLTSVPAGCHNPFLSRALSFRDVRSTPEARAVLMKFLGRYGTHVWHFGLSMDINEEGSSSNANTIYQLTRAFLMLLPNLKSLDLCFCAFNGYQVDRSEYLLTPAKEELIRSQPLPPLNDLITLKHYGLINPLESAIWRHYGSVRKLALRNDHMRRDPLFKDLHSNARLDHLEELYISPGPMEDFDILRNMSMSSPWPLSVLSVDFLLRDEGTLEPVFRAVTHFGATLRHVGIQLRVTGVLNTPFSALFIGRRLNLPRLETLKLRKISWSDSGCISSLGFLEPCSSLKRLDLSCISQYSLNSLAPILSCPLRALKLTVLEAEDLGMVLAIVSQLGATLRNLEIYEYLFTGFFDVGRPISRLNAGILALPRLENLVIQCRRQIIDCVDFIQGCVSLRKLVLVARYTDPSQLCDSPQFIQFRGYFSRMNDSNIWTLLPDLQTFELDMRVNASTDMDEERVPGFVEDGRVDRIYNRTGYSDLLLLHDEFS